MAIFVCDFSHPGTPFHHFWEHTVGSGHAPLALRSDWQIQLKYTHRNLGFQRVRFHGILSGMMHTVLSAGKDRLEDSFFNADQIVDFLLNMGMRPWVELSFMPRPLASGDRTTFAYAANVTPPADYEAWGRLIGRLGRHWVERYGADEVARWYFEVWNEPDREQFWSGGQEEYFRLYQVAARALKEVEPRVQVGGPASSQGKWIAPFLSFCEENDVPVDFVSTHAYPNDPLAASGKPIEEPLSEVPRDIMRQKAQAAREAAGDLPLYFTEWNTSSDLGNALHDQPYAAAFIVRTIMSVHGLVDGYSFWTFSDIFEEQGFHSAPFHGGFGLITINGVAKPAYRAFQILHELGDTALPVEGEHETVEAWAVRKGHTLTVLLTNFAAPLEPIEGEHVQIRIENAPLPLAVSVERIDDTHANPYHHWVEMGRPPYLDGGQREELLSASQSVQVPIDFHYQGNTLSCDIAIPAQAVAAVWIEFVRQQTAESGGAGEQRQASEYRQRVEIAGMPPGKPHGRSVAFADEETLLTEIQHVSFRYLDDHTNLETGLVADRSGDEAPASIAATGMALTAYPVAVERGFLSREEAIARTLTALRFFWKSDQAPTADATGYKGFYYHFLDMKSGERKLQSELSSIDTGCLLAGALTAATYFDGDGEEQEIRVLTEALLRRVDWEWMRAGALSLSHGWKPDKGFLSGRWIGYSEALFLYLLALGTPHNPLPAESYDAWTESYTWRRAYGYDFLYGGPLFIHHYPHLWVDFRDIQDRYMREKGSNYFENSRRATYIQQRYAIENPLDFEGYSDYFWGLTAVGGPGPVLKRVDGINRYFYDYVARGVPYGPDDGTVAPWVVFSSLPFAPEIVLPSMRHFVEQYPELATGDGCTAAVNPTHPGPDPRGWIAGTRYGINQMPVLIMLENYRTGLVWKLMRGSEIFRRGLRRAGFEGGWLEENK